MGRPIKFWVNSGIRVGGSKVNLFVITGQSSSQNHSLDGSRGRVCFASHHSLVSKVMPLNIIWFSYHEIMCLMFRQRFRVVSEPEFVYTKKTV